MEQLFNIQILERAGLAAVALASVWANYKLVVGFNKTLSNHIHHNTESNEKLKSTIDRLIKFLEKRIK